jgi:glutathione S-transferase
MPSLTIVGRSSSHFTRIARVFALELGVEHAFRPVLDLTSTNLADYGANPAMKVPVLVDEEGPLFGTENICRALVRRSGRTNVLLRGDVGDRVVANAEEMTLHAMSSEVTLILSKIAKTGPPPKVARSMENALAWLDENVGGVIAALPADRATSFAEVALFCLVTHLPWREVMDVSRYERLAAFERRFAERESAQRTAYRFDAA